ncbi:MAG: DNA-directed DNA polymerase II small subunit [Candidatus Bathyarchaeia archaeon]
MENSVASDKLRQAVTFAVSSGYQLDQEAFNILQVLSKTTDVGKIIKRAIDQANMLPERPLFITRQLIEDAARELLPEKEATKPLPPVLTGKGIFHPYAKEVESNIKIVEDPTATVSSTGNIDDFLQCFRDRFLRIEKLLRQRLDARDAVPLRVALEAPPNTELKTIGIVTEKRERKRRVFMQIEDLEVTATIIVPPTAEATVIEKAQKILLDQVICINARRGNNDILIAIDFIWPDLPDRKPNPATENIAVALTSDLHVGSKTFLRETFNRVILWLNGKTGNGAQRELAGRVKYFIIAGDLVDGIGVYPEQERELIIHDIYEQYRVAAQFIEQIPDYIEVILIPGNHDATRQALPQPAIPRKYAEPIYEMRRVIMLGDPAKVVLHGVSILLYHGRSLEDVIGSIPNLTYRHPEKAMELLLRSRHLAPVYGKRTPIAPEPKDYLVIDDSPDIFHSGHVHINGYTSYRGVLIVNSGAWQSQTSYQRKMGLEPTPGKMPIVDLQKLHLTEMNFTSTEDLALTHGQ